MSDLSSPRSAERSAEKPPELGLGKEEVLSRLASALDSPFLLEKKKDGKRFLDTLWHTEKGEEEAQAMERRNALRYLVLELETRQRLAAAELFVAPDPARFGTHLGAIMRMRQQLLGKALERSRGEAGKNAHAFHAFDGKNLDAEVSELEDLVYAEPPQEGDPKHRLYVFDKMEKHWTPNYPVLAEADRRLQRIIAHGIDSSADPAMQEETRAKVERLREGLRTIRAMNPIAERQFEERQRKAPGMLEKPVKFAAFGIASVLGVMSLIPVLAKLRHGKEIAATDWPAFAWPALALSIGGFLPRGKKDALAKIAEVGVTIKTSGTFRDIVGKMGGVDIAKAATEELHDLLQESKKRKALGQLLEERKVTPDALKKFLDDPKSLLLETLSKSSITDSDRYVFLGTLSDLDIRKDNAYAALIAALENKELMKT